MPYIAACAHFLTWPYETQDTRFVTIFLLTDDSWRVLHHSSSVYNMKIKVSNKWCNILTPKRISMGLWSTLDLGWSNIFDFGIDRWSKTAPHYDLTDTWDPGSQLWWLKDWFRVQSERFSVKYMWEKNTGKHPVVWWAFSSYFTFFFFFCPE